MKIKNLTAVFLAAVLAATLCACFEVQPKPEPTAQQTSAPPGEQITAQTQGTTQEWDWDGREIPVDKAKIVTKDEADYPEFLASLASFFGEESKPIAHSLVAQKQESYLDVFYRVYYAAFPDFREEIPGPGAQAVKDYYARQYREAQEKNPPNSLYETDTLENWEWEAFQYTMHVYAVEFTERYLSVNFYWDYYGGGAHGDYGRRSDVFSLETGKKLELDDIVRVSSAYAILNTLVEEHLRANDIEPFDEPFDIRETPPTSFRMTEEGPVLIYNPYDIASFADGLIEIPVPLSALGG